MLSLYRKTIQRSNRVRFDPIIPNHHYHHHHHGNNSNIQDRALSTLSLLKTPARKKKGENCRLLRLQQQNQAVELTNNNYVCTTKKYNFLTTYQRQQQQQQSQQRQHLVRYLSTSSSSSRKLNRRRNKLKKSSQSATASTKTTKDAAAASDSSSSSSKKRRKQRPSKSRKQQQRQQNKTSTSIKLPHRSRPILTEDGLEKLSSSLADSGGIDLSPHGAKNQLNKIQTKLSLDRKISHDSEGPSHDRLFVSTNTITIPQDVMGLLNLSSKAEQQFECTGAARTKKRAEFLAAVDVLQYLQQQYGINVDSPPDIKSIRSAKEAESRVVDIQKIQMLMELLNVTRLPQFETIPNVGSGYTTNVRFYYQGRPIFAEGKPARSKKESKENAWLAIADALPNNDAESSSSSSSNDSTIIERYEKLIDKSPANQVVALHIPKLSDEMKERLEVWLGDENERNMRKQQLLAAKAAWVDSQQRNRSRSSNHQNNKGHYQQQQQRIIDDDSQQEVAKINQYLIEEEKARYGRITTNPDGPQSKVQNIRDALPIKDIHHDLIDALKSQQVVVVSGGTGSGKSTQCPQYILEDAISNEEGSKTRIVVTQPRRIAAISVAERVAYERDEQIGNSIGYTVRFNTQKPREIGGSIEFVTTGILLRRMVNDPSLEGISHVIIDEVHERDIDTDFLLILLRDLLPKKPDLRLILMSATLDAQSFASYFSSSEESDEEEGSKNDAVPVMSVPPKPRHPVEVIHLSTMAGEVFSEDQQQQKFPRDLQDLAKSLLDFHDQQLQREMEEADAEEKAAMKLKLRSKAEDAGDLSSSDSDSDSESDSDDDDDEEREGSFRMTTKHQAPRVQQWQKLQPSSRGHKRRNAVSGSIDREMGEAIVELTVKIAQYVAKTETDGSILCFLPGWDEINQAMRILEETSDPSLNEKMLVLPLHSTIPQDDQQKVFTPAKPGTVKVILATNIAESSVTIDDVLVVVDSGLVRELNFDPEAVMSAMETVTISRASATQRLGRAGRVAPGKCYRLYSQGVLESMAERPTPELQRTALEATCLNTSSFITAADNGRVATFLQRAMDPPKDDAIASAMDRLVALGAIDVDPVSGREELSPLGHCLSKLPLDPATGKMLLMGCVLKCLDPVLTAAACFSSRPVFFTPLGMRNEQRDARKAFCDDSDLIASIRAYDTYQTMLREQGWDTTREWASDNFVSIAAMNSIRSVRSQLLNELRRIGLVDKRDMANTRRKTAWLRESASVNINADLESLHVALWAVGLPDNLAARRGHGNFGTLRTRMEPHAGLHPSSVAFHRKPPDRSVHLPPWFFYRTMIMSSEVFLRECTSINPEQIALFGGYSLNDEALEDDGKPIKPMKVLDDWIVVKSPCDDTLDLLSATRDEIQTALQLKTMYPRNALPPDSENILDAVCDLYEALYTVPGEDAGGEDADSIIRSIKSLLPSSNSS